MAPYRSREEPRSQKAAPQTGLVADMVRQFADVHAFVRELVQNGIDAGATGIEVVVDRGSDGVATVRVTDDGCGMTVETIESALLVLFRSTKDEDATKIGKYGVGFMSVFAIAPSEVTVDTWRDGHAHRVRLFPDHSYEIEGAAPREGHGTSVTLSKAVPAEEFAAFWGKVGASLHRWCRHAEVPIHLTVTEAMPGVPPKRGRVDTPLAVRSVASVRQRYQDMEIVVGPIAGSGALPPSGTGEDDPAPFAGFYNRGLTLHETTEPIHPDLAVVRLKVQGQGLRHTLSRDDVRRDHLFHMAVRRARELVRYSLRLKVLREAALEAEAVARGGDGARLATLLEAATMAPVDGRPSELRLPLAHAIAGKSVMSLADVHSMYANWCGSESQLVPTTSGRSDLTEALAALGVPVIWTAAPGVAQAIGRASNNLLVPLAVEDACLLVRELPAKQRRPGDDALCSALGEALTAAGIERVALGIMPGSAFRGLGVFVRNAPPERTEHVVVTEHAAVGSVKRWPAGALLVLRAGADAVNAARRAGSPDVAAHLLARYLLLSGPKITSRASEAMATRALERIR